MSYGKKVKRMVVIIAVISILIILAAAIAVICLNKAGVINKGDSASTGDSDIHEDFIEEKVDPEMDANYYVSFEDGKYEAKNDEGKVTVVNKRNILVLRNDGRPRAAKNIQDAINGIMNDQWDNDMKRAADDYRNYGDESDPKGIDYFCDLVYQDSTFITFSVKASGDIAGAALSCDELYTFSVKTGERLSIDSCAADPAKMKSELIQETKKYLKEHDITVQDVLKVGEDELFSSNMSRQGNFGIIESSICVKYQKNQIADESAGVISISLGKDKSNSLLKDGYKID